MQEVRAAIEDRLRRPAPYPADRFSGRGIVTCAGGRRYFTCVWILIWLLRRVQQSPLPIQVWHLGRKEMSDAMRLLLEAEGVEVINAETMLERYPAAIGGGWPLKPYAIAHSRFREVLFLDADTVPLADPGQVFEWDAFRQSGLLLWPDVIDVRRNNPIWTHLGLEPRNCVSVDSGVVAVDKERNFQVLDLAVLLNEQWADVYKYLHGDKDTFLFAAMLAGDRHRLIEHRPFHVDGDLVQRDGVGDPFIHHRTASKWKFEGVNRPAVQAEINRHCEEALAELRRRWTGCIFHPPDRTEGARAEEAALIAVGRFVYATTHEGDRLLELLPAGAIGEGRSDLEQHWAVVEGRSGFVLQFYSASRRLVELQRQADGSWQGTSLGEPEFEARLVSEQDWRTWPHADRERVHRSAETEVAALLDAALFATGFDAKLEQELRAALSLLNRLFDDVPEQMVSTIARLSLSPGWQARLEALAQTLREARDGRLALAARNVVVPVELNPNHYSRIF